MNCLHCSAETSNGLALCETCRAGASVYLEFFPVYFRNLARWRPGRSGVRSVPSSREPQGPAPASPDRVSRALDEAGANLLGWAKCLSDDRGVVLPEADDEAASIAVTARLLLENLTSIATLEWAGEFVREIGVHESRLRALTMDVIPGWYAGGCGLCGVGTYVVPGLTWVTCGGCGVTTYARDHLETILDESRSWVARPMRLAEALVALLDTEQSIPRLHKRISKWGERDQITTVRRDEYAPKQFRLGEVMDRLLAEGATRLDEGVGIKAS